MRKKNALWEGGLRGKGSQAVEGSTRKGRPAQRSRIDPMVGKRA